MIRVEVFILKIAVLKVIFPFGRVYISQVVFGNGSHWEKGKKDGCMCTPKMNKATSV